MEGMFSVSPTVHHRFTDFYPHHPASSPTASVRDALRGSIKTGEGVRLVKPAAVAERWDPEWRSVAQRGASSSLVSHGLGQGPPNRRTHQTRS